MWLHNSVRGAVGLALAVLVAQTAGVQHSFWVVFGTLSVLRSNALNTGQNAVRGILGTVVGFVIGAVLLALIGTDEIVLWVILPFAVLLAGTAPALISFTAGQAAFTLILLIMFNIIAPEGWRLGSGAGRGRRDRRGVSLVVGVLFWPRGAGAALRRALADAYPTAPATWTARSRSARCAATTAPRHRPRPATRRGGRRPRPGGSTTRSGRTSAERGAKPVPLADVMTLVNGVVALRLAADAVLDLWQRRRRPAEGDRAGARAELMAAGTRPSRAGTTTWPRASSAAARCRTRAARPGRGRAADRRRCARDLQGERRHGDGDGGAGDLDGGPPRRRTPAAGVAGRLGAGGRRLTGPLHAFSTRPPSSPAGRRAQWSP